MTTLFSLQVRSDVTLLPDSEEGVEGVDLEIRLHSPSPLPGPDRPPIFTEAPGIFTLHFPGEGAYRVTAERIEIIPSAPLSLPALRETIFGPALACALHLRGRLVLHAAALRLPSGAGCLLMGETGAGKSTLAAHLLCAGAQLLSEELAPLRFTAEGAWCDPGAPVMRLDPAWQERFALCPEVAVSGSPKRAFRIPSAQMAPPTRITRLYLLERGREAVTRLEPGAGLQALFTQLYLKRHLDAAAFQKGFLDSTRLLKRTPLIHLRTPAGAAGIERALAILNGGDA